MKIKEIHLLAHYYMKPRDPSKTKIKGYMSNPDNVRYDEGITFTKGLAPKDHNSAKVILNLNTKSVVKNGFGTSRSFDDFFKYYLEAYPQYVIQVMAQLDMPYLEQFIPKEDPVPEVTDVEAKEVSATE
jgi:hypothetical protein